MIVFDSESIESAKAIIPTLSRDGYILACASDNSYSALQEQLISAQLANYFNLLITKDQGSLDSLDAIRGEIDLINEVQKANPVITSWQQSVQVIVPISDLNDPFVSAGYGYPGEQASLTLAPLIEVDGKLMLQNLVNNLNMNAFFIFVVTKTMYTKYTMKYLLETLSTNPVKIVVIDDEKYPGMPMCAQILMCKDALDPEIPVIVTSCTQLLEWDSNSFLYSLANPMVDAGVLTFQNRHPRFSFVSLDNRGWITDCKMNQPFSNNACAGIFYWKRVFDLIKYSSLVVSKGQDSLNKYGPLLAMKEALKEGKKIKNYECRRMWELSTPNDLSYFHLVQKPDNS
ncbi:hypothetical protein HDU91_006365 [Kappamyces sp. JEL0680]|nr:hypothetical protein HDU91_006365 [Kappamyces sp. JEL0680]